MITKVVDILRRADLVDSTNDQIIEFGLRRFENTVFDFLFTIICAALLGNFVVGILFEISYVVLRVFAGGYHASSEKICKYLTYVSTIGSMAVIFLLPIDSYLIHFLICVCVCVILFCAPAESENKPLSTCERKVYYRYCVYIILLECILYCLFICTDLILYAKTICVSVMLVAIGVLAGLLGSRLKL